MMSKITTTLYILAAVLIQFSSGLEEISEYLQICHKNDPKLVDCMIKSIEFIRPYLAEGIPKLNIPAVEPLIIGELLVSERTQSNGLRVSAKDIKAYGPLDFKIKKLEVVKYGEQYNLEVFLPHLYSTGIYEVNGQILLLPIKGTGTFRGNFTDCIGKTKIYFDTSKKDSVVLSKIDMQIIVGKGGIQLDNLFNGNRALGDAINAVINQNFDVFSKDIIPLIEHALQKKFKKISNRICNRYTFDQLFPN